MNQVKVVKLDLALSPLQRAKMRIEGLRSEPAYRPDAMIGGTTPPEMLAENARRKAALHKRMLEIIREEGAVAEFLEIARRAKEKLQRDISVLQKELAAEDAWIAELQKLRDPS